MSAEILLLSLVLSHIPFVEDLGTLPAGNLPAGVLFQAYTAVSGNPLIPENERVGNRSIRLAVPLVLHRDSEAILRALLRKQGIFLMDLRSGRPKFGCYATTDPTAAPPLFRPLVRVHRLRYIKPDAAIDLLRQLASQLERSLREFEEPSRFVADERTGAVVVNCFSRERLRRYLELLEACDIPPEEGTHRPILRTWKARYVDPKSLAELLEKSWQARGGQPLTVVVQVSSGSLLIRVSRHLWPEVEGLLGVLDRRPGS
ncbi:MAG TPA: hypothetical protein EYN79_06390 [Planctomycetes bacterium]|nr:hypothetical protein [Planctomycetota bacterium]HIN79749.1 hypothetical protein [Planctomycetota bacterium]